MKSKAMKQYEADLAAAKTEAQALQNKPDATAAELDAATDKIKAIKAKIATQEALDEGKTFDDAGNEVVDRTPVDDPIYAEPKDHKGPFKSFGEQMLAIVKSSVPGAQIDNRLIAVQNASGANETVPSEGGFAVQKDFESKIMEDMHEVGILANLCTPVTISANSNGTKMNGVDETSRATGSRWGGVQGYWVAEAGQITASKPSYREIELALRKVAALYYATDELLQDAAAIESIMSRAFAEELAFLRDDAIFRGDGTGKPLGFMNSGCLVTVSKETGQAADTVLFENITKMWNRLIGRSRRNAVWLINQEVEPQLDAMVLSIGTGGVISPIAMEYMTKGTIKGRPVIPIEHSAALGDLGDIALVDLSQYLLASKGGVQTASSIHVKFDYDETAFRAILRVDGQPIRASALTPYKGASTLSSFVTLAERA